MSKSNVISMLPTHAHIRTFHMTQFANCQPISVYARVLYLKAYKDLSTPKTKLNEIHLKCVFIITIKNRFYLKFSEKAIEQFEL